MQHLAHLPGILKLLNSHVRVDPEKTIEGLSDREEIFMALHVVNSTLIGKGMKLDLENDTAFMQDWPSIGQGEEVHSC